MNHFCDAEDGDFLGIHDDINAGFAHAQPAHAEYLGAGSLAQGVCKPRGVHVPRCVAGRDKYLWTNVRIHEGVSVVRREWPDGSGKSGPRHRQLKFLVFVLKLIEPVVDSALGEKLLMRSFFT